MSDKRESKFLSVNQLNLHALNMMRIGYFTSIDGWGGSESYLKSLMQGVRNRGHEVVLFGIKGTRLYKEATEAGIDCVAWKASSRNTPPLHLSRDCMPSGTGRQRLLLPFIPAWIKLLAGNAKEVAHLRRLFKNTPVDVMHISVSGYEVAGIASLLAGVPSLAMNMTTPIFEGSWCRRWLIKVTARMYDLFSSQSHACTSAWIEFARLRKAKCSYVWSSVDLDSMPLSIANPTVVRNKSFRVVSLGRLHPMKGYKYLIEATHMLCDENVIVDIYGEGGQRSELESLIKKYRLQNIVRLHGHIENTVEELQNADCFVLPSVSHESCPAVLPEAMASSLPLVTSDFGPLAEVNIDGVTGIVVPMRNSKAIADAIRRLCKDRSLARKMGLAGHQRAHEHFSRDRMVEETLQLYSEIYRLNPRTLT